MLLMPRRLWNTPLINGCPTLLVGLAVLLSVNLASPREAWAQDAPKQPVRQEAVVALADRLITLDPAIGYDWNLDVIRVLFDGLLDADPGTGQPVLQLAKSHDISSDGLTHTFALHPNILFHHGREMTAQDVKYSLERVTHPNTQSPGRAFFQNIVGFDEQEAGATSELRGIEVLDRYRLRIRTVTPDSVLPYALAINFGDIVPQEVVEQGDFGQHPVGTGPFQMDHWTPEGHLVLSKFPQYFHQEIPKMDRLTFKTNQSIVLSMRELARGTIHMLGNQALSMAHLRARKNPRYQDLLVELPERMSSNTIYVTLHTQMEPFTRVGVRRAINLAINTTRLANVLEGVARPAKGILPPAFPGEAVTVARYPYDRQRAQALLAQEGLPHGFTTDLFLIDTPLIKKIGRAIQRDLARIGITVRLHPLPPEEVLRVGSDPARGPMVLSEGLAWFPDYWGASNYYYPLLSPASASAKKDTWNWAFYQNSEVDRLAQQARALVGPEQAALRAQRWQEVFALIMEEAPWVPLYHRKVVRMRSAQLKREPLEARLWDYYRHLEFK